ncbi:hypothetical protein [Rubinisphaera margarita]|uniref:hypothetical protein n=1 Tax=Rubinisphaera margarita TaxID=2909586 RepID=UPI001EE7FFCC|nr:hypothetical protein [Rubinisphaera margarita]MCG6155698.1 hypothetical protein [Rubinisphaera margarita]
MRDPIVGVFPSASQAQAAQTQICGVGPVGLKSRAMGACARIYRRRDLTRPLIPGKVSLQLGVLALVGLIGGLIILQTFELATVPFLAITVIGGVIIFLAFAAVMLRRTSEPDVTDLLNSRLGSDEAAVVVDLDRMEGTTALDEQAVQTIVVRNGGHCIAPDEHDHHKMAP